MKKIYVPTGWIPPAVDVRSEDRVLQISENIDSFKESLTRKARNLLPGQCELSRELMQREELLLVDADKNLGPVLLTNEQYVEM